MTAQEMQEKFGFTLVMSRLEYGPGDIFVAGRLPCRYGAMPHKTQVVIRRELSLVEVEELIGRPPVDTVSRYYAAVAE